MAPARQRPGRPSRRHHGCRQSALAPLEESGLIQRTEDPEDRRVKMIALTEKGAQTVQEAMRARHAWLDDLAVLITEQDKAFYRRYQAE